MIAQAVELPNPTIEMNEPPVVTRGSTPSVETPSGTARMIVGKVMAPAGLQTFTVNDRQEKLDGKGLFLNRARYKAVSSPGRSLLKYSRPAGEYSYTNMVTLRGISMCSRGRAVGRVERGQCLIA